MVGSATPCFVRWGFRGKSRRYIRTEGPGKQRGSNPKAEQIWQRSKHCKRKDAFYGLIRRLRSEETTSGLEATTMETSKKEKQKKKKTEKDHPRTVGSDERCTHQKERNRTKGQKQHFKQ